MLSAFRVLPYTMQTTIEKIDNAKDTDHNISPSRHLGRATQFFFLPNHRKKLATNFLDCFDPRRRITIPNLEVRPREGHSKTTNNVT